MLHRQRPGSRCAPTTPSLLWWMQTNQPTFPEWLLSLRGRRRRTMSGTGRGPSVLRPCCIGSSIFRKAENCLVTSLSINKNRQDRTQWRSDEDARPLFPDTWFGQGRSYGSLRESDRRWRREYGYWMGIKERCISRFFFFRSFVFFLAIKM